ncbi:MAG: ATP-grasp domain-containing protein, partial [Rhodocyclaceae bacterium]|nr:ATP-grasp domain-containing protein [Rhodocyclaceae bacterium]
MTQQASKFTKILIANRGEIACRVIRTARAMGYATVAVYSDADAKSPHVSLADEAVRIGGSAASESYLNIAALMAAAQRTGADAVHPGYGFLSENATFAQTCIDNGLVFIGPPPEAIIAMGDKALAKRRMIAAKVPTVPGYLDDEQSDARLLAEAKAVGFPLLVKAVAGGGGRGMRLVASPAEMPEAIAGARREALSAFGSDVMMLERLIERGRHIEIQIFADAHGNAVHLGERDCTAQRRRQKVIEEAPSPIVSPKMRETMGADAVAAALAVGYRGAGTVEFIVDADLNHYFLEMNTRLQVEHPVTELITGLDLVEWQLRVAAGEPLPLTQKEIEFSGHAIEARLYAEDPYKNFAPQTGQILHFRPADAANAGVRIDAGIIEGGAVTPFYDAMVAKVIGYGKTRTDAIRCLMAALADAPLLGLANNGRFLHDLVDHDAFRQAEMYTSLLDEWAVSNDKLMLRPEPADKDWVLAAALFADGGGWRSPSVSAFKMKLCCGDVERAFLVDARDGKVTVSPVGADALHDGMSASPSASTPSGVQINAEENRRVHYEIDGLTHRAIVCRHGRELHISRNAAVFVFSEVSPFPKAADNSDPRHAKSSVAGTVARLDVGVGDTVKEGQTLAIVEAMKMETRVIANSAGKVS